MVILRNLTNELLQLRWILFGFVTFIFSFGIRKTIIESNVSINAWELLIILLSDVNLIIYFVLPFLLYFSMIFLVEDFEYHLLIRFDSYRAWVFMTSKKVLIHLILTIIVWFLVSVIMTIGFPLTTEWSLGSELFEPPAIMKQYFDLPAFALIYQLVMFFIMTSIVLTSIIVIHVFLQSWSLTSFIIVILYIFSFVSWKMFPEKLATLSLSNYVAMYQSLNLWKTTLMLPLIAFLSVGLIYLAVKFKDKKHILNFTTFQLSITVYLSVLVSGTYFMVDSRSITVSDLFLLNFFGTSSEGYTLLSYMYYIVAFIGFLYLVQVYLSREFSEMSYYKIIRYSSMFKWMGEWLSKIIIMAIVHLTFMFFMTLTVGYLKGLEFSLQVSVSKNMDFSSLLYHFFINGILQICVYLLLLVILQMISKNSSINLISIGILLSLLFLGHRYVPVGLNGYSHLIHGTSPIHISIYLSLVILVEGIILFYVLNKKYALEGV